MSLLAALAVVAFVAAPAFAHHQDGHDGGPSSERDAEDSGDQSTSSSTSEESDGPAPGGRGGNVPCPSGSTEAFTVNGMITNGTYTDGTLTVSVTSATNTSFNWSASQSLSAVLVKAGPTTEVNSGGTAGTAQSPFNQSSGQRYDISHVTFCYTPTTTTELCPAGTDMAGLPPGVDGCNIQEELCPAGTDMAGQPVDEVESCTDDDVLGRTDKVCPAGSDFAGQKMDDVEDCNRDRVLPNVITRGVNPSDQAPAEVEAGVLPFTGGAGLTTFFALGAMLIALGCLSLRSRRKG